MFKWMKVTSLCVCFTIAIIASSDAAVVTYSVDFSGDQEVPGPGDPDGVGSGLLTIDDVSDEVSWNFAFSNIAAPTAMHIHGPGGSTGNSAAVLLRLGLSTTGGPGTLIGSVTGHSGDGLTINSNPSDFYVNIHNSEFGPGAIRGQLTAVPEPSSVAILACGGAMAFGRRRRRTAATV